MFRGEVRPPPKKESIVNPIFPSPSPGRTRLDWLDPKIYAELIVEIPPPSPGEVLPYKFDDEDEVNSSIIPAVNGLKLEEVL
jgi:hypothetical protein